jgi:hypothetical protein
MRCGAARSDAKRSGEACRVAMRYVEARCDARRGDALRRDALRSEAQRRSSGDLCVDQLGALGAKAFERAPTVVVMFAKPFENVEMSIDDRFRFDVILQHFGFDVLQLLDRGVDLVNLAGDRTVEN